MSMKARLHPTHRFRGELKRRTATLWKVFQHFAGFSSTPQQVNVLHQSTPELSDSCSQHRWPLTRSAFNHIFSCVCVRNVVQNNYNQHTWYNELLYTAIYLVHRDLHFYARQQELLSRLSHRNSFCLSDRPSVRHTGGSGKNGAS